MIIGRLSLPEQIIINIIIRRCLFWLHFHQPLFFGCKHILPAAVSPFAYFKMYHLRQILFSPDMRQFNWSFLSVCVGVGVGVGVYMCVHGWICNLSCVTNSICMQRHKALYEQRRDCSNCRYHLDIRVNLKMKKKNNVINEKNRATIITKYYS